MTENKLDLTIIILTKNEEQNIKNSVNSAKFAKEIIVFDSESIDKTIEIAQNLGAKVIIQPWCGSYAEQRNLANNYAAYDWIMQIDADETITEELAKEIADFFDKGLDKKYSVARFPLKDIVLGKWVKYGGWYPQYKTRFYKKNSGKWVSTVHERYEYNGERYTFKNPVLHNSYKSIEIFIEKMNKYSSIDAKVEFEKNKKFSYFKLFFQPLERFFGRYIIHKGYKDGLHGFICAFMIALNYFLRHLKLWELCKKNDL